MKVIVTGGRDYDNYDEVCKVLDALGVQHVVTGGAKGADRLAETYIDDFGFTYRRYEADWDKYGKAAGPIRNRQMLEENKDCIVIAFPGGKGTADCVRQARQLGMVVLKVEADCANFK